MAKKELTEEQKKEIKILQANAKMLQKTKKEAEERGKDTKTIELIDIATNDVLSQMALIDEDSAKQAEQVREMSDKNDEFVENIDIKIDRSKSVFDVLNSAGNGAKKEESVSNNLFVQNPASNQQYDIVALPSNGEGYKSKISRIPVAFLTAYDENLITSPSLYRDGLVIDCLLKSKIVNTDINPDFLQEMEENLIQNKNKRLAKEENKEKTVKTSSKKSVTKKDTTKKDTKSKTTKKTSTKKKVE